MYICPLIFVCSHLGDMCRPPRQCSASTKRTTPKKRHTWICFFRDFEEKRYAAVSCRRPEKHASVDTPDKLTMTIVCGCVIDLALCVQHHIAKMLRKKYPDVDLRAIESAGRDIKRARAAESE